MKRGYVVENSTIEIYEGNLDVICYNNPKAEKIKFYFYRFPLSIILPDIAPPEKSLLERVDVEPFLNGFGFNYDELKAKLVKHAEETGMRELYDL